MIERLKTLQAKKGQFTSFSELTKSLKTNDALRSNNSLRKEVEELAKVFLKRNISGCSSCYMDAYIELINLNIEKVMSKIECQFTLPAGQLLRDRTGNTKYLCSQFNITDELALYHLKTNPSCVKLFAQLPEGWEKMVENFELSEIEQGAIKEKEQSESDELSITKAKIVELEGEKTTLEGQIVEKNERIIELESQLAGVSRSLIMEQARAENDVRKYVAVLTRTELLELIDADDLAIEIADEMTDDAVREAIIAECEEVDAIDANAQKLAENTLVLQIAERIKAGETKTSIKDSLKDGKVGEKNLTQRFISELVARADELNK